MPAWILWLSPVIIAPLLAVAWITWAARPKAPEEAREGVEQYDRVRAALSEHPVEGAVEQEPTGQPSGDEHRPRRHAS